VETIDRHAVGGSPSKILDCVGRVEVTKAVFLLVAVCLLLTAPRLAYGSQTAQPVEGGLPIPGAGHQPLFMPQDQCAQPPAAAGAYATEDGCVPVGSAGYVVGNVTSHGGPVMHAATNYAIFWLPPGYHFDTPTIDQSYANASDVNYEALVGQFFGDLSNTAYYSIVQQYVDLSGPPGFATSFGGAWVDTSPYPNSEGSKANPLQDSDIEAEVAKAMSANGWSAGNGNHGFFVFTGQNVFGCAGSSCSYKDYCAYHSAFQASDGQDVVYADVPDPGNANNGTCLATAAAGSRAPNSGAFADSAVDLVAHEGFEAVTDPVFNGWYYQDIDHEIGDECVWKFGSVASDGGNIALNGHRYLVQEMWSNDAGGCYIPQASSRLVVMPSYQVQGGGSGFTPPAFTYFSAGVLKSIPLSTTAQTLNVDLGSVWSVTGTLPGSTPTERWQIGQASTGVLSSGGTFAFTYYHQYLVNFGFVVSGGGSAYSAPSVTITQFGNPGSVTAALMTGQGTWADAQSGYNYTGQLPGSGPNERWTASSAGGTVASSGSVNLHYYHQYLVPVSYTGGGGGSSPPVFTYSSLGRALNATLEAQPQSFWLDAGVRFSATNPLGGSTATERWFSSRDNGTASSTNALQLAYYQQYFVSVKGGSAPSDWFNDGAQAIITQPGVYARSLGGGSRVTGYHVDGGPLQAIAPTTGQVEVVLQMNGPHVLNFSTVAQYQVSLDSGASAALLSVTPPTVPGDGDWYDSGSRVTLMLDGAWGRGFSSGNRLVSYAIDGGTSVAVASTDSVEVMQSLQISSPHSVTAVVARQYLLSTEGGSVQSSTPPSIPGDVGWYDSGSEVAVLYNYVWNETLGTRMNVLGVIVDGVPGHVARSGTGTFQKSVLMDGAHVIEVVPAVQYQLAVSGGSAVITAPTSPTGDEFYDSGSSVSVSSARIWDVAALSREALISFSIDGGGNETVVPTNGSGGFSTPSIAFDRPHQVVFGSATQYLIGLRFTDALGTTAIIPTSLQIGTSHPNYTLAVQGSNAWLDAGSTFVIRQLVWENADVKPLGLVESVDAPQNFTVAARVYDATLRVSDYLQIPISGASATIHLANGTSIARTTGTDGTISMALIPLGRFNATVSYLGASQGLSADLASQNRQVDVRLPASLPDFALVGGAALAAMAAYAVVRRRRRG
jgi:hypothetical protein